jgi:hypothetical protein
MAQITIDIPDKALDLLKVQVDDFNAQTDHDLTLTQWLISHILAVAINPQLAAEIDIIRKEHDAELPRRIDARRRELLSSLEAGAP